MLKYNLESRKLTSTFKAYRNDVSIFTEDEEKDKEFYTQLLKRVVGSKVKINDITPLGCKKNVIEYCLSSAPSKKEVYIIDGDIKVVNDSNNVTHPKLFILDRYCIENYLLDENSVIKYIYNSIGTQSEDKIKNDLKFDEWLMAFSQPFIRLFIHFAISDLYEIPFALFNSMKYITKGGKSSSLNIRSIDNDISLVKAEIINKIGEEQYNKTLKELETKWVSNIDTLLKIVSGKTYLIPLLQLKANEFKKAKNIDALEVCKIRLVQHFDVAKLDDLKSFIEHQAS